MALLGAFVDSRTLAGLTTGDNITYAHGLPATPDLVHVHENTTTNNTSCLKLAVAQDATNVTIYNHAEATSATLEAVAIVFHTVVE